MRGPEQRQIVVLMVGGNGGVLPLQRADPTALGEDRANPLPQVGVRVAFFGLTQHIAEDRQQRFGDRAMLLLNILQPLPSARAGPPDSAQKHFDEFVAGDPLGLIEPTQEQRVTPSRVVDIADITDRERRRLGGKLADLGVRQAFQQRPRVQDGLQFREVIDPELDAFQGRWTGGLFGRIKGVVGFPGGTTSNPPRTAC